MNAIGIAVFDWVIQTSVHGAVLVGLILVAQSLMGGQLSPRWRYRLWLLLVLRLLMPALPQSPFSVFNLARLSASGWPAAGVIVPADPPFGSTQSPAVQPKIGDSGETPPVLAGPGAPTSSERLRFSPPSPGLASPPLWTKWRAIGMTVWLVGVACSAMRWLWSSARFSFRLSLARPVADAGARRLLEECRMAFNLRCPTSLLFTSEVSAPAACGFWRKRVLMPYGIFERFGTHELRLILLHELAHIKRRDLEMNCLSGILLIVHWFNPVLWLAFSRMRKDRELATDALVLKVAGEQHAARYGETILSLLESMVGTASIRGLVGIAEGKSDMKRRISMIARFRPCHKCPVLVMVVTAVLFLVSFTGAQDTFREQSSTETHRRNGSSGPNQAIASRSATEEGEQMGPDHATDATNRSSPERVPIRVSTYAGSVQGSEDGDRTAAAFQAPSSLTFDPSGRLWITEATFTDFAVTVEGANRIRILDLDGTVSTVAGSREPGLVNGPGLKARFSGPHKVAFDHRGNVFVADTANHCIRKIDAAGVSTFAGSTAGFRDGFGANAMFHTPLWVVSDPSDNLFVADFENLRIRKITPDGLVTTYAGSVRGAQDGPLGEATFNSPNALAFAPDGALLVSDWLNGKIRRIKDGIVTTFATGPAYIDGVNSDKEGNIYAAFNGAHYLAKYSPDGSLSWTIPTGQGFEDGPIESAKFGDAVGAPLPLPDGSLLVYDVFNDRIRKIQVGVAPVETNHRRVDGH
jgi:beta-lactamase regulating signal transducer with metallopeptidase domain/sugar lactone lactonase YvrE